MLVENIKKACQKKQITLIDLERRAGLPINSIYKWDRNDPSIKRVARVASILGVTVDELLK